MNPIISHSSPVLYNQVLLLKSREIPLNPNEIPCSIPLQIQPSLSINILLYTIFFRCHSEIWILKNPITTPSLNPIRFPLDSPLHPMINGSIPFQIPIPNPHEIPMKSPWNLTFPSKNLRRFQAAWPSAAQLALRTQQLRDIMKLSALETQAPPQPPRPNQELQRVGWGGEMLGKWWKNGQICQWHGKYLWLNDCEMRLFNDLSVERRFDMVDIWPIFGW